MTWAAKRDRWRDPEVARTYDERRFRGRLGRLKHARDARLVLLLLARAGGVRRVLDLPAGTGRLLPELAGAGLRAAGADLAREMLRAGAPRASGGLGLLQAAAERLPFQDGAFDAVVSLRFLFHVDDAGARAEIYAEMARVARAVIGEVRLGASAKHVARRLRPRAAPRPAYARAELERELARSGLALVELRPISRLFSDKALFLATRGSARG